MSCCLGFHESCAHKTTLYTHPCQVIYSPFEASAIHFQVSWHPHLLINSHFIFVTFAYSFCCNTSSWSFRVAQRWHSVPFWFYKTMAQYSASVDFNDLFLFLFCCLNRWSLNKILLYGASNHPESQSHWLRPSIGCWEKINCGCTLREMGGNFQQIIESYFHCCNVQVYSNRSHVPFVNEKWLPRSFFPYGKHICSV